MLMGQIDGIFIGFIMINNETVLGIFKKLFNMLSGRLCIVTLVFAGDDQGADAAEPGGAASAVAAGQGKCWLGGQGAPDPFGLWQMSWRSQRL